MIKLAFLGTKGEIEESTPEHQYHSSLLIAADNSRLLLDYGRLHRFTPEEISPGAMLITHAHPDHYAWLEQDIKTEIPVFLTRETFEYGRYRPANSRIIEPGQDFTIGPFQCRAYRVVHSIRCPAVGYRVRVAAKILVYNPDLVDIVEKAAVLDGVNYYIGDGSAVRANLVRRRGDQLFGHTRMTTQINWCRKFGIKNIIFTHLGRETLAAGPDFAASHDVLLAYDGLEVTIE